MNTGLQDAYNLGWKLALVAGGQADARLLDTYEEERIPVARRLLDTTDRAFRLIVADNWLAGLLRTQVLARVAAFAMGLEAVQRFAFRTVSQIGIDYRTGALSQATARLPEGAPREGDRFPWLRLRLQADGPAEDLFRAFDDLHFHLFITGQPAPQARIPGGFAQVHVIPGDTANGAELARARIPQTSFYLVRPDGYIGLCGTRLEAGVLERYFAERLGVRG